MALIVRHLDCVTMCPVAGAWINQSHRLVGHCLLVETPRSGLVLIDTGIGTDDVAEPRRLGRAFVAMVRPTTDRARTAVEQVRSLGHDPGDVRHIIVTHLDLDHAGGLGDFPNAVVHLHADELAAARRPRLSERNRYRSTQWAHGPRWEPFEARGDEWFGFAAARSLPGLPEEILAVPLPGHTRGHSAIAVESQGGWLLHCGDAYFHESEVDPSRPKMGPALRAFEALGATDRRAASANRARLAELHAHHGDEVRIFSAHDPAEFDRLDGAVAR